MKKIFLIIVVIIIVFNSCNTKIGKRVEGDLYFKSIELESLYLWPDSTLTRIENFNTETNKDTNIYINEYFTKYVLFLKDYKLLRKPFLRMRLDNGRVVKLFLDSNDFKELSKYNWGNLIEEKSKIRINVNVTELIYDTVTVYNAIKFISINKIKGQTFGSK